MWEPLPILRCMSTSLREVPRDLPPGIWLMLLVWAPKTGFGWFSPNFGHSFSGQLAYRRGKWFQVMVFIGILFRPVTWFTVVVTSSQRGLVECSG